MSPFLNQALILSGAYYAIVSPEAYGADLLPEGVERVTVIIGQTTRGQMLTGGLGSCESRQRQQLDPHADDQFTRLGFLLLAMMSLSLFPIIRRHLVHEPHIQEKLVRGMLVPLAIADVGFQAVR